VVRQRGEKKRRRRKKKKKRRRVKMSRLGDRDICLVVWRFQVRIRFTRSTERRNGRRDAKEGGRE
jgi:hypothetical protein